MKKQLALMGVAVLATFVGLQTHAGTVIGNFEGGSYDGWAADGTAVFSFDTLGATLGSNSLKIVAPSGWGSVAKLSVMSEVPLLSQAGTEISLDLTLRNDDNSIPGWWEQFGLVLNSDGGGWYDFGGLQGLGVPWSPTTYHMTWTISADQAAQLATSSSYVDLLMVNNSGGAALYVDNIQITTVPEPATTALLGVCLTGLWIIRRRAV